MEDVTRMQGVGTRGASRAARFSPGRAGFARRSTARPRVELLGERTTTLGLAIRRLEREHVALLLATAELDSSERRADVSTSGAMNDVNEALRGLLREDLRRTQHALTLATQGRYGVCETCGRPLSRRRLELAPATTRCPSCETGSHLR